MTIVPRYAGYVLMQHTGTEWQARMMHAEKREADLPLFQADQVPLAPRA